MIATKPYTYDNHGNRVTVAVVTGTKIPAIDTTGQAVIDGITAYESLRRERAIIEGDPVRLREEARLAAEEAGRSGTKTDAAKKILKQAREAAERIEDLDLEVGAAAAHLQAATVAYYAAIEEHATDLAAAVRAEAEAGILSIATASKMARQGGAQVDSALAILSGLAVVDDGGDFRPGQPRARSAGSAGRPLSQVEEAVASLTTASAFATEILSQLRDEERLRASAAALQAETDSAPDIDDEDDDDE